MDMKDAIAGKLRVANQGASSAQNQERESQWLAGTILTASLALMAAGSVFLIPKLGPTAGWGGIAAAILAVIVKLTVRKPSIRQD